MFTSLKKHNNGFTFLVYSPSNQQRSYFASHEYELNILVFCVIADNVFSFKNLIILFQSKIVNYRTYLNKYYNLQKIKFEIPVGTHTILSAQTVVPAWPWQNRRLDHSHLIYLIVNTSHVPNIGNPSEWPDSKST